MSRNSSQPQMPRPETYTDVVQSAIDYMDEHGLSAGADGISAGTVALAIHTPEQIKAARAGSFGNKLDRVHAGEDPYGDNASFQTRLDNSSRSVINDEIYRLSKGARVRRYGLGLLLTVGVALGMSTVVAGGDAGFREYRSGEATSALENLSYDESILPGDLGADTPFVRTIRKLIPGMPDRLDIPTRRTVEVERTIKTPVRLESDYNNAADVVTPQSPDLDLTGSEYALAHEEAEALVEEIEDPEHFTVTEFGADGRVSDEYNGQLGKVDPEQVPLFLARGAVAGQALEDVLDEHGIETPVDPTITGHEVVLTPTEINTLHGQALQDRLSRDRGATLWLEGRQTTTSNRTETRIDRTTRTKNEEQIPNEALLGLIGLPGLGATAFLANSRLEGPANRAARRRLKKAEKRKQRA